MEQTLLHKPAETSAPIHDLIRERWSPRSFAPQDVSDRDLETILEAGRWAASSYNEQPWRFVVAKRRDEAAFQKILGLLVPMNQAWARNASVLIITAAKKTFSHNNSPNYYGLHDTGAATANMFLQASALDLRAHGMGGFDHDRAQKELHIPDDFVPGAAIAIGYPAPPEDLPEQKYRDMERAPRVRKPLAEIAFSGDWGQPLPLTDGK